MPEPAVDRQYGQEKNVSYYTLTYLEVVSPTLRGEAHKKLVADAVDLLRMCKAKVISENARCLFILDAFSSPFPSVNPGTKVM